MAGLTEEEIEKRIADSYELPNNVLQAGSQPLVTVRTSTYNHGPYIRECIEGVLAQKTDFPFELIIGEDFSTDGTREIVFEYAKKYPDIIRVITADYNVGAKANGRRCIQVARGKYMAICEGDDYWHDPDKLQRQVDILEADPEVSLVATDADALFVKNGRRIVSVTKRTGQLDGLDSITDMTAALIKRQINLFACSVCMRSDYYVQLRNKNSYEFSSRFKMGDVQTWWEMSRMGRIVIIPESMATYRVMKHSASHSPDRMKIFDFYVNSLELHEHYVKKFGYGEDMLNAVRRAHLGVLLDVALRLKREDLREKSLDIIESIPTGLNLPDGIMAWGAKSPLRFTLLAPVWPAVAFGCKVLARLYREAKRVVRKVKWTK